MREVLGGVSSLSELTSSAYSGGTSAIVECFSHVQGSFCARWRRVLNRGLGLGWVFLRKMEVEFWCRFGFAVGSRNAPDEAMLPGDDRHSSTMKCLIRQPRFF